ALAIVTPLAIIAVLLFLRYLLRFPRIGADSRTGRLVNKWRGKLPQVFTDSALHFGFLAVVTGLGVGLVLTDSGVALPSSAAMVRPYYLLALSAEHAEDIVAESDAGLGSRSGGGSGTRPGSDAGTDCAGGSGAEEVRS